MKAAVLFLAIAGQWHEPPDVPALKTYSDFPLKVHLFGVHWNRIQGSYSGYGRGNLLGPPMQGFDYTFECSEPFLHNADRDEFYQARWKKQDEKLEILMQKVGSDHLQKCDLKTALKPKPYGATPPAATPANSQPVPTPPNTP